MHFKALAFTNVRRCPGFTDILLVTSSAEQADQQEGEKWRGAPISLSDLFGCHSARLMSVSDNFHPNKTALQIPIILFLCTERPYSSPQFNRLLASDSYEWHTVPKPRLSSISSGNVKAVRTGSAKYCVPLQTLLIQSLFHFNMQAPRTWDAWWKINDWNGKCFGGLGIAEYFQY